MPENNNGVTDAAGTEQRELATVLASAAFARAQRLVKLLEYICEKHFEGRDAEVCEYSIATEVLGRPSDFDPAEDAIARVEIHRLRKKLREYYAAEGARQAFKIIIPPGMYTPLFQDNNSAALSAQMNGGATLEPAAEPPAQSPMELALAAIPPDMPPAKKRGSGMLIAALMVITIGGFTVAAFRTTDRLRSEAAARVDPLLVTSPPGSAIRIIAGYDRKYIDHRGNTWFPDRYFEGGALPGDPSRQFIARTSDPPLYQNGRVGINAYNIPLEPGNYELKLHFVEPQYGPGLVTGGGENSRVFDILLNGKLLIDGLDIVSDAGGPLIADTRVFKDVQPGPDGMLRIGFHPRREQPIISAIEIEPAEQHRLNPIRLVTQPNSVTDSHGQVWEADNYYLGGQTANHFKVVTGAPDADLFSDERYGHFSYAIPVAPGSYTVNMYFAENYWGKGNQGAGGPGMRLFDIYCDGAAIVRNLDILKEAGPNRALIKKFRGLRPTAQGKLNFEFVPSVNYASVYAIEVLDEGR